MHSRGPLGTQVNDDVTKVKGFRWYSALVPNAASQPQVGWIIAVILTVAFGMSLRMLFQSLSGLDYRCDDFRDRHLLPRHVVSIPCWARLPL